MIPKDVYHEGKRPLLRVRLMDVEDIPRLPWTFWDVAVGLALGCLGLMVIIAVWSLFA